MSDVALAPETRDFNFAKIGSQGLADKLGAGLRGEKVDLRTAFSSAPAADLTAVITGLEQMSTVSASAGWEDTLFRARVLAQLALATSIKDPASSDLGSLQGKAQQTNLLARNRYFIERGVLEIAQGYTVAGVPHDSPQRDSLIREFFKGGVAIETWMASPPHSGYEGSAILSSSIMHALVTLRAKPDLKTVVATSPLRLQCSSAGGSDGFANAIRDTMLLIGAPFYINNMPAVAVRVSRTDGEFSFFSADLGKQSNNLDLIAGEDGKTDPLRLLKRALPLACVLSPGSSAPSPIFAAACMGAFLEGDSLIQVGGGVNSVNALCGGGLRALTNEAGAYDLQSLLLRDLSAEELTSLSNHFVLFSPGLTKPSGGKASTSTAQLNRGVRVLANDEEMLASMSMLKLATTSMRTALSDFASSLNGTSKNDKALGVIIENINDVQRLTASLEPHDDTQHDTVSALRAFMKEAQSRYQKLTDLPLGAIVQGAGPIGGVLFVAHDRKKLEGVLSQLVSEMREDNITLSPLLKLYGTQLRAWTKEGWGGVILPTQIVQDGLTTYGYSDGAKVPSIAGSVESFLGTLDRSAIL